MEEIEVKYPIGHKNRREEGTLAKSSAVIAVFSIFPLLLSSGTPVLEAKFKRHLEPHFSADHVKSILELTANQSQLEKTKVSTFVDMFVTQK